MKRSVALLLPGSALLAAAVLSLLVLGLGHKDAPATHAQAMPEMDFRIGSCEEDCTVIVDSQFALSVEGTVLPEGGYGGFGAEVYLGQSLVDNRNVGGGMRYANRPCDTVVLMEPLGVCVGPTIPPSGNIIIGGLTALGFPFPTSTSTDLLELAVTCEEPGDYEFVMTAFPSSPFGSQFSDANAGDIPLRTVGTRTLPERDPTDPDLLVNFERDIAASINVECLAEAPQDQPTDGEEDGAATATPPGGLPGTGLGGAGGNSSSSIALLAVPALVAGGLLLALGGWRRRQGAR